MEWTLKLKFNKVWRKFSNNRKGFKHVSDFWVIMPDKKVEKTPAECPVCKFLMSTANDVQSYENFLCCFQCELKWVQSRRESWVTGWRQSKEEIKEENVNRQRGFNCR